MLFQHLLDQRGVRLHVRVDQGGLPAAQQLVLRGGACRASRRARGSRPSEQLPAHVRNAEHSHQKLPSPIISQLHAQGEVDPVQKQRGLMARA